MSIEDFSKYIIVTDLDGTFFGTGGKAVPKNLEAVEHFKAHGGIFTIATGRIHHSLPSGIPDTAGLCNAPLVMCNGAYLYDFGKGISYSKRTFSAEDASALLHFMETEGKDIPFSVSTQEGIRMTRVVGLLEKDILNYAREDVLIAPSATWRRDDWHKVVCRGEPEELAVLRERLLAKFGDRFTYTRSGRHILEILRSDCNKGAGFLQLRAWFEARGVHRRMIACGDYDNDREMLTVADIAICPENAHERIKPLADHVLCHCNEGLTAEVIAGIESGRIR